MTEQNRTGQVDPWTGQDRTGMGMKGQGRKDRSGQVGTRSGRNGTDRKGLRKELRAGQERTEGRARRDKT